MLKKNRPKYVPDYTMEGQKETESSNSSDISTSTSSGEEVTTCAKKANLAGFWILGLCNNFAYVIMLSAAHDILTQKEAVNITGNYTPKVAPSLSPPINRSNKLIPNCNPIGTGAILLADILPTLIVKLSSPLYIQLIPYGARVAVIVIFAAASFPIVSLAHAVAISLLGVVCASISAGLGEITFLSMTSFFHKHSVSTWSSGTGAAGVFGALSYAGLTTAGLSPRDTLLIMLVIPALMLISYFCIIKKPKRRFCRERVVDPESMTPLLQTSDSGFEIASLTLVERITLIKPLLKYMIPLCLVYFAEYFINQALFELIYFEDAWLKTDQQYRWYQVIYQVGVFLSRSSVNILPINKVWILTILQFVNVGVLMAQVFLKFIPNIWIIFAIILFEGLLGGAAYVNTFYKITKEVSKDYREYSLGVASMADSLGIAVAGAVAIPVHNLLCTL